MQTSSAAERRARWAVAVIFLANGFFLGTWAALIPAVEERLRISHGELGIALLSIAVGAVIAMPLGGVAISRLGSATVLRIATICWFTFFSLPMLAPDLPLLILALFFFGASNGVMDVAMNAHGVAVEQRLARPVMSSFHGMFSLGGLIGAGAAAVLLPISAAVSHAFLMSAIAGTICLVTFVHLLPAAVDSGSSHPAFAMPSRATFGIGALCFLALVAEGAMVDWSALHMRESLALGAGPAAIGFAAFSGTMAIGRFLGDWLRAHVGAVVLVRVSAYLAALGMALALVPVAWVAIAGFAIVGLGLANLVPIFFGAGGKIPGQSSGTGIAAIASMGYFGFLAGPPVIGFAAQLTNLALALGLVFLCCLLIGLFARAVAPAEG
jgi:MFS family permease